MIDVSKKTFGQVIKKSPPFAKEVVVSFSDDISTLVAKIFREGKGGWQNPVLKEVVLDWNLSDSKGKKLPISTDGLDTIQSTKLRNWILVELLEVIGESLSVVKKK